MAKKPTFEVRLKASRGRTSRAILAVTNAIEQMQIAADEHATLVTEIDDEISRLASLQDRSERAKQDNQNAVDHLKGLIS